ncbi:MAG: hypothetical protein NC517_02870 [Firmicutes bacterium]|nr:hypothetical protein [Bacillota bacterium]
MKKKFLACLLAGAMALSMAACGDDSQQSSDSTLTEDVTTPSESEPESTPEPTPEPVAEDASIDFEDGNMGFVSVYSQPADAADVELSIADFGGSKALQVKNLTGKVPYVAIDATSLLGADVAKVASIELNVGVSYEDGSFNACSGALIAWSGADLTESRDNWSVYLEKSNPKKQTATLSAGEEFVADAGNMLVVQLKTDNGVDAGAGNATMYIDDIRFLDASGNLLTADSSATFVANAMFESSGPDYVNLAYIANPVNFDGFACTGGGWAQNGFEVPQTFLDALVPGSVIEIEYKSDSGNMWMLMNGAAAGWIRVGCGPIDGLDGEHPEKDTSAYYNSGRTKCQITFEQLAAWYTDDVSTWGTSMQCESDSDWEVFSVKVGQASPYYAPLGSEAVEFSGFACSGDGWAQNGFDMPQEILDALVPGSVVEISYTSENDDMWLVMPGCAKGWKRVGHNEGTDEGEGYATCDGSKCYVPYEMLEAVCGGDVSTFGTTMQCEASGAWEVYSVKVGPAKEFKMMRDPVEFSGFACSGDGWAQNGFDMPQEILDALVPGSVVEIAYTSENDDMWLVMPGCAKGWKRVGHNEGTDEGEGYASCNGSVCQVPYEMLEAVCGGDVSTFGTTMQCEASGAWEVYSVSVGMAQ